MELSAIIAALREASEPQLTDRRVRIVAALDSLEPDALEVLALVAEPRGGPGATLTPRGCARVGDERSRAVQPQVGFQAKRQPHSPFGRQHETAMGHAGHAAGSHGAGMHSAPDTTNPSMHSKPHCSPLHMAVAFAGAGGHGSQPAAPHPFAGPGARQIPPQDFSCPLQRSEASALASGEPTDPPVDGGLSHVPPLHVPDAHWLPVTHSTHCPVFRSQTGLSAFAAQSVLLAHAGIDDVPPLPAPDAPPSEAPPELAVEPPVALVFPPAALASLWGSCDWLRNNESVLSPLPQATVAAINPARHLHPAKPPKGREVAPMMNERHSTSRGHSLGLLGIARDFRTSFHGGKRAERELGAIEKDAAE